MRISSLCAAALASAVFIGQSGCAAILAERSKTSDPKLTPKCSAGRGGVFIDGVFTVLYGVGGLIALSEDAGAIAILPLLAGAGHVASAVSGTSSSNQCKSLRAAHDDWVAKRIDIEPSQREKRTTQRAKARAKNTPAARKSRARRGRPGGLCFIDGTCAAGFTCLAQTKTCVVDRLVQQSGDGGRSSSRSGSGASSRSGSGADSARPAGKTAPVSEIGDPFGTGTAPAKTARPKPAPATKPAPAKPRPEPAPATKPAPAKPRPKPAEARPEPDPPDHSDGPWNDFWREDTP